MIVSAILVLSIINPPVFGARMHLAFTFQWGRVLNKLKEIGMTFNYTFSVEKDNIRLQGILKSRVKTFYFFW